MNVRDRVFRIRSIESDFLDLCKSHFRMTVNGDHQIPNREEMRVTKESDRRTFTFVSKRIRREKRKRRQIDLKMLRGLHRKQNDISTSKTRRAPLFRQRKKKMAFKKINV